MKIKFIFIILSLFLFTITGFCKNSKNIFIDSEKEALEAFIRFIKEKTTYTLTCSSILIFTEQNYFTIKILEKHGGKCPGDPMTSPARDHFKVNKYNGKVSWYNVVEGNYLSEKEYISYLQKKSKY